MPLAEEQLGSFAERGFVVIRGLVPRDLIEAATKCVDALIERDPPPPDHRGPHFYWRNELAAPDPLLSLVADGMVRNAAEAMIKPLEYYSRRRRRSRSTSRLMTIVPEDRTWMG
jgi:hypothetical protein